MKLHETLVRSVTAPWYTRHHGFDYRSHMRRLDESQWYSSDQIAELQQRRLREIIEFAYRNNDHYRAEMDSRQIMPSDIKGSSDLTALPLLQKDDIRRLGSKLFSRGYSEANTHHTRTGGSTGVPLHVYIDKEAMNWKYAATWRHNSWAGWQMGTKVAALWGDTEKAFNLKAWLRYLFQHRTIFLDTLKFSDHSLARFYDKILRYRPQILMGHAHSVYQFARFCSDNDLRIGGLSGIVTTAMTLAEHERQAIESAFDTPVFNRYGCEELSIIASDAEPGCRLHVFSEGLIVEYLPTPVAGEYELVITDLLNRAMPMIRYVIGDIVRPASSSCRCGRGLTRFERVSGRTADFLYRPDGVPVFGISILDTHIIHIPGIKQAQIVQDELQRLTVNVVPDKNYSIRTDEQIHAIIGEVFGDGMTVDIEIMDALPMTERGKYRFSICNIDEPGIEAQRPAT